MSANLSTFIPLRSLLPTFVEQVQAELGQAVPAVGLLLDLLDLDLPTSAPAAGGAQVPALDALDVAGFTDLSVRLEENRVVVDGRLDLLDGYAPRVPVPGLSQLSLAVTSPGAFHLEVDADGFRGTLRGPSLALQFAPEWLRPASPAQGLVAEIEVRDLGFLDFDSKGNLGFGATPGGSVVFVTNNDPWMVGDSGLLLETGELRMDLTEDNGGPAVELTGATLRFPADVEGAGGGGFTLAFSQLRFDATGFSGGVSVADAAGGSPLAFSIPGLPDVAVVLGTAGGVAEAHVALRFDAQARTFQEARVEVPASLRVGRALLRPAALAADGTVTEKAGPYLTNLGQVAFGLDAGLQPFLSLAGVPDVEPFLVGSTGVAVAVTGIGFHFGEEAARKGVSFATAMVAFPKDSGLPQVALQDAFIGQGGFSGSATATFPQAGFQPLFGFDFALDSLALSFAQSLPTAGELVGRLRLPFFDAPVGARIGVGQDGDFSLALESSGVPIQWPGVAELKLQRLSLDVVAGEPALTVGGTVRPTLASGWPEVDVRALRLRPGPRVELEGGWLDLPSQAAVNLGPFGFALSRVGFGTEGAERWMGFTGGIRLHGALPAAASAKGLRIIQRADGGVGLACEGASLSLEIPGTLRAGGAVAFDQAMESFTGSVDVKVLPVNLGLGAAFFVGRDPATGVHAFGGRLQAELPTGIPLLNTGLAIYELSALGASQLEPTRQAGEEWFPGWYLRAPAGSEHFEKWAPKAGAFALGMGVSVGTAPDDGYSALVKALLLVVVPGPILMLDGRANLVRDRREAGGVKDDRPESIPLFRALAVYDGRAADFKLGISAELAYRRGVGDLLTVRGSAEAYYHFQDSSRWYLHLGTKQAPLRGKILESVLGLDADAYWMMDARALQLGAALGLAAHWDFSVTAFGQQLGATVDALGRLWFAASVNWKPTQAHGELGAQADVVVTAFGAQLLRLALSGLAEADAPRPFRVNLSLKASLDLPWPLPDANVALSFAWERPEPPPTPTLLSGAEAVRARVPERVPLRATPTYDADGDGFLDSPVPVQAPQAIVELDARPRLSFSRPVHDEAGFHGGPGVDDEVAPYTLRYALTSVRLRKHTPQGPQPVHGFTTRWKTAPGLKGNQLLEVWGTTPFSTGAHSADGGLSALQDLREQAAHEPCGPQARELYVSFDALALGTRYPATFTHGSLTFAYHYVAVPPRTPLELTVEALTWVDPADGSQHAQVLRIPSTYDIPLVLRLPWPAQRVRLLLQGGDNTLVQAYGRGIEQPLYTGDGPVREAVFTGDAIHGVSIASGGLRLLRVLAEELLAPDLAWLETHRLEAVERLKSDAEALTGEFPLLEPDSVYELEVSTSVRRSGPGAAPVDFPMVQTLTFETRGPPRALAPYVRSHVPAANARPVFRGYDLGMDFQVDYVERMYSGDWALGLQVVDENGRPARRVDGGAAVLSNAWAAGTELALTPEEQRWVAIVNSSSCGAVDVQKLRVASSLRASGAGLLLEPKARHTAHVVSKGDIVYQWDFVTSAYVSFVHQLGDFRERAFQADAPSADVAQALQAADALEDADARVEALLQGWFPPGFRALPLHPEVTVLRMDGAPVGLLVESPEPIDWSRTSVSCERAAPGRQSHLRSDAPAKVLQVNVDPEGPDDSASYAEEWVDVLLLERADLGGWQLQDVVNPGTSSASWRTFYTFPPGTVAEGTRIRVHSGSGQDSSEPDLEHRYVSTSGGGRWLLNNEGDSIRLVRPDGVVAHEVDALAAGRYASRALPQRRSNRDGTRTFFVSQALLPGGTYRLRFSHARAGAGLPTLSRGGRTEPETVELQFVV